MRIVYYTMVCFFILMSGCAHKPPVKQQYSTENPASKVGVQDNIEKSTGLPLIPPVVQPVLTPVPYSTTPKVVVPKVLASFQTKLLDRDKNRIHNLELAAEKVRKLVVAKNQVFSFNDVVGDRDEKHGYKKAMILVEGEKEEGIGGGVCQLSSTLFNAAQKAGMEIMERHNHSGDVHYVPIGKDAAVNYGYEDFKFRNTSGGSIKFKITIVKKYLTVTIIKI